jgi:hypothetical protein
VEADWDVIVEVAVLVVGRVEFAVVIVCVEFNVERAGL